MNKLYSHTLASQETYTVTRLRCNSCGKTVSSPFIPLPTDTAPEGGLVVRAFIECPECIENNQANRKEQVEGPK